ncbi:MAG: glycosyltransferase family 4 protein [Saprospiraceae bacterium]|nr:glycosyltransferase family 4 protein [Saprospiraceae bacterium]
MKIAVNTRLLLKNQLEGIGWFTFETLKRITQQHPEHEFIFIFDRKFDKEFIFSNNIKPIVIGPPARHPILFYLWFEFSVRKVLRQTKSDVFLSPDGYLSLKTKVPSLAVIHDLNFEHYPKDLPWLVRKYLKYYFPKFAAKAKRIATVSKYSAMDIVNNYGIDKDKIDVVFNGINENFKAVSQEIKESTKRKLTNGKPYFISVGSIHPRKNLANLLKAFDKFKDEQDSEIQLLIVGEKMWKSNELDDILNNLKFKSQVIFTGRLQVEDLINAYGSALALTYISYFEGFGIPILEAFQCDVPVITSNVTSMPEVADKAALLVDPFSVDSIKDAMIKIANDENLRNELIEKGRIRREEFSWQKSADKLWESIIKTSKSK